MRDPIIEAPAPGRLCVPHQAVHVTLAVLPDRCGSGATLVRLSPRTGRTHQLRVHCASGLGASIIGDVKYGFGQGNSAATADFVRSKLGSNHVQLCLHAAHIGVSASRTLLCTFAIPATRAPIVVPANYHSTAQHSTAQHSTAQHSTAQHSTALSGPRAMTPLICVLKLRGRNSWNGTVAGSRAEHRCRSICLRWDASLVSISPVLGTT
jgi:hypothetical protein